MADISQYVHKFRANGDNVHSHGIQKPQKRNRQPLSCVPCRQKKLKCDRQQPCETCVKRNDESACLYSRNAPPQPNTDPASRAKAQERLRHLEQLVMQMYEAREPEADKPPTPRASASPRVEGNGRDGTLECTLDSSKYVGSTHWSAILSNIQELKATMADDNSPETIPGSDEVDDEPGEQDLLFGPHRSMPLQQILEQYLPPRRQTDRWLYVYFNSKYMVIPYIHTGQFKRQYEQFWEHLQDDPSNTASPLWVSALFSILCLGAMLMQVGQTPGQMNQDSSGAFLNASAQCLILGGYTKPRPFVIEALALYAQCKFSQTLDPSREVGIIFAIGTRLAYRMAYHRDADNFKHFSVFEGEMRRRVWTMLRQFDLMTSFQLGLPNNIAADSWDTKLPRNLLDADFDEDSTELPPSRPENEATQILYFIVKARIMTNFGRICSHALSFKNSSQDEIMNLDNQVRETFVTVPDVLRVRPMSQSYADPPYLIMVRLNCEFLYQKSLMVLHRKYMTQDFQYSSKACVDAALAITKCFADINKEFLPGGFLYQSRWMLGSFTLNDFHLAAMILCLALSQWRKLGISLDEAPAAEQLKMVQECFEICQERASTSAESRKVAEALGQMLSHIKPTTDRQSIDPGRSTIAPRSTPSSYQTATSTTSPFNFTEALMPQAGGNDPWANATLGPYESILDPSDNIDWSFLDQYMANPVPYTDDSATAAYFDWPTSTATTNTTHPNAKTNSLETSTQAMNLDGGDANGDGSGIHSQAIPTGANVGESHMARLARGKGIWPNLGYSH